MFPIKPGQTNYLSANMGELRPNHFHAGLDIKTDMRTGLPVYCSADGYVSRIKISSYGYGKVLYITHPNTLTTVYAHLDSFNKVIGAYALNKHYELESFDYDIYLKPEELVVKKGEVIGYSGNTGSSGGPHLHYEIRDAQERVLNPLHFGFDEVKDNSVPIIHKIALRTFEADSRINNDFGRFEYSVVKSGNTYSIPQTITAWGTIGLELRANDKMDETYNSYGVSCIDLKLDGKEVYYHNISTFGFDENRYINVHLDYETYIQKRQRFERCYIADGNKLSSYKKEFGSGKLRITDTLVHEIEIAIYDADNNTSVLKFKVKGERPASTCTQSTYNKKGYDIFENILKISSPASAGTKATLYNKGTSNALPPAYHKAGYNIYLYDLRKGLPDSFELNSHKENFRFVATIPPGKEYSLTYKNLTLNFADTTLFDTLYLQLETEVMTDGKETFNINSPHIPVFGGIQAIYCPEKEHNKDKKCYIYTYNGPSSFSFEGGEWEVDDKIFLNLDYLGKFVIVKDTISPVIKLKSLVGNKILFNIFDSGSGIGKFRAQLNGHWVLMNYDHKTKTLWSELQKPEDVLKGDFILEVTDKSGNTETYRKML